MLNHGHFKVIALAEAQNACIQYGRELFDAGVEFLHCVVVILAGYGNAVFGACQFVLQLRKVGVGLKLRIVFGYH